MSFWHIALGIDNAAGPSSTAAAVDLHAKTNVSMPANGNSDRDNNDRHQYDGGPLDEQT